MPGVGKLISTAVVAAIGTGEAFDRGRDFGASLGLVPRQHSTGSIFQVELEKQKTFAFAQNVSVMVRDRCALPLVRLSSASQTPLQSGAVLISSL